MNPIEPVPGGTSESSPLTIVTPLGVPSLPHSVSARSRGQPRPRRGQSHQLVRGLSLGVLGLVLAGNTIAKDLMGVYEDALKNDPQIRAADANRLASRESRPQALAALLPQISGTAAYTRDHNGGNQDQLQVQPPTGQLYVAPLPYTAGTCGATVGAEPASEPVLVAELGDTQGI